MSGKLKTIIILCITGVILILSIVLYIIIKPATNKPKENKKTVTSKVTPTEKIAKPTKKTVSSKVTPTEKITVTPIVIRKESRQSGITYIIDQNGVEYTIHYDAAKFPEIEEWGGVAVRLFYAVDNTSSVTINTFQYENFDYFAERTINKFNDGRQVFDLDGHRCIEYTQLNSYDKKYCVEIYDNGGMDWLVVGVEFKFMTDSVDMSEAESITRDIIANFVS